MCLGLDEKRDLEWVEFGVLLYIIGKEYCNVCF